MQAFQQIISQERYSEAYEGKIKEIFKIPLVTYPNIFGNNNHYKKFIILSTQRSGSSYLENLLQSHPQIVSYSELFHPERCPFDYPLFPEDNNESILRLRNYKPKKFLKKIIFRGYEANFGAVGFKIHYSQLEDPRFKPAVKWLYKEKSLAVIHLIRNNFLDILVSHKLALATQEWWKTDPRIVSEAKQLGLIDTDLSAIAASRYDTLQIEISPEEARFFFEQQERHLARFRECFKKHPVIEVAYENLIVPDTTTSFDILNFLGVTSSPLFSRIVKQKKRTNQEIIKNFPSLKRAFEGTRWVGFFD